MTILVTGSTGHLGEALMRTLTDQGRQVRGIDIKPSPFTDMTGSITDPDFIRRAMTGITDIIHAATLHKPHVGTHANKDFIDTNVAGTMNLLEQAVAVGVTSFVFTSTTSAFGAALRPAPGEPAAWITEDVLPVARNIYGVTKVAAEGICELFARTMHSADFAFDLALLTLPLDAHVDGIFEVRNRLSQLVERCFHGFACGHHVFPIPAQDPRIGTPRRSCDFKRICSSPTARQ